MILGMGLVNPRENFRITAQHVSKAPATAKNNQFIFSLLLKNKKSHRRYKKYLPGFYPSVNTVFCAFYLGADQLFTAEPYKTMQS